MRRLIQIENLGKAQFYALARRVFFSIPFITIVAITLLDALFFVAGGMPGFIRLLRDGILIAALVMVLPLQQQFSLFQQKRITLTLRNALLALVTSYIVFTLVNKNFPSDLPRELYKSALDNSFQHFMAGTVSSLFLTLMHLVLLGLLRILVLYKSRSFTLRNFRLLLIGVLAFVAVSAAQGREANALSDPFGSGVLSIVTFCFMVIMMAVNSSRLAWVNFLNRRQKWQAFFLAVIAGVLGFALMRGVRDSYVADYSVAYASVISSIALFGMIYAATSAFSLLLHLPTAGILDERLRAIRTLQELSQSITHFMEKDQLMAMITQRALEVTQSDFAWLELVEEKNDSVVLGSSVNLNEEERRTMPLSQHEGITGWVAKHRQSLLANDVLEDQRSRHIPSWKKDIGAILAVPLISQEQIFGILYCAKHDFFSYDQFDQQMLQSFADQAAIAFSNARLLAASLERERLAHELRVAHEAQEKLLPKTMPQIPGLEVAGVSIAAHEVGGDYYDVMQSGNKLIVVVGDVSGKGAAAAFYMAQAKGVVEALGRIYESPREVLLKANQILSRTLEKNLFISLLYAVFDPNEMRLTLSRAGHTPLLRCPHSGEPHFIMPGGLGIGLDKGTTFEECLEEVTIPVSPGDYFLFYTDGVIEARNANNEEFDEVNLFAAVKELKFSDANGLKESLLQRIYEHVGSQRAHDDFTLVVVGMTGEREERDGAHDASHQNVSEADDGALAGRPEVQTEEAIAG